MRITITATRSGLTPLQMKSVIRLFTELKITKLIHGCAVGGDQQIHYLTNVPKEMHPSKESQQRWAERVLRSIDELFPIHPPIPRNHIMVNNGDCVIAAPKGKIEQLRGSGTWATIRYAKKIGKKLYICWPDGTNTAL